MTHEHRALSRLAVAPGPLPPAKPVKPGTSRLDLFDLGEYAAMTPEARDVLHTEALAARERVLDSHRRPLEEKPYWTCRCTYRRKPRRHLRPDEGGGVAGCTGRCGVVLAPNGDELSPEVKDAIYDALGL